MIQFTKLRWESHVARIEKGRSVSKILTGKLTGNRPLQKPKGRWEDNIRMDLKVISINTGNSVHSAQDTGYWKAFVNEALSLRVP